MQPRTRYHKLLGAALGLLLACGVAGARGEISMKRAASKRGEVDIENAFGSVKVVGWDRAEIALSGQLAAGVDEIEFEVDDESASIGIEIPDVWIHGSDSDKAYRSTLEIHVPFRSQVTVETINASVTVLELGGTIDIETINGSVVIKGNPSIVEVESLTGSVQVAAESAEVSVESVSGAVSVSGAARTVDIESVSGAVSVAGRDLVEVDLTTTSGGVSFSGSLAAGGAELDVETFSGQVDLVLPAGLGAEFDLQTFSGTIECEAGPLAKKDTRYSPSKQLHFRRGNGEAEISVETFSGSISVRFKK